MQQSDRLYFQRCFDLAHLGNRHARPNPKVGAVIVYKDKIIGEGFHEKYGGPHAEVNAVANVKEYDKHLLSKSTIYVSLEPCHHYGKTPPCVDLIIKENIPNIKIALPDPSEKVFHKSITKLKEHKRSVTLVDKLHIASDTIEEFISINERKRPFIQIKVAKSAHNYMGNTEEQIYLTNKFTNVYTHKLRAYTDAILIGTNTAAIDDPSLTLRNYPGEQHPTRIVLDRQGVLHSRLKILSDKHKTIIVTEKENYPTLENKSLIILNFSDENFFQNLFAELIKHKIYHVMVEGGSKVIKSIIKANIWDEAIIINTEHQLANGIKAPSINGRLQSTHYLLDNTIHVIKNDI